MTNVYQDIRAFAIPRPRAWQSLPDLHGHVSPVTTIAEGRGAERNIVTGGYDGHVILWDHAITEPLWSIRFPDLVNALAIDTSQRYVATAVADSYVYILDSATGLVIRRLGPHGDDVNDVAWHPTQPTKLAVVCDADDTNVYVWDVSGPVPTRSIVGRHDHGVFAVAYSPTGEFLATASEDSTVRLWSVTTGIEVAKLAHPGDVETLAWSPDGLTLATGCDDARLRMWTRGDSDWYVRTEMSDATASVRCVGFSPSGRFVSGASYDGTLRLYEAASGRFLQSWKGMWQWERACLISDDESIVVGSFADRPIRYQIRATTIEIEGHTEPSAPGPANLRRTWGLNALTIDRDQRVLVGTDCGIVSTLDDGKPMLAVDTLITSIATCNEHSSIAVTDYLGRIFIIEPGGTRLLATTRGGPLNTAAWLDDQIVTGGYDGVLRVWALDGTQVTEIRAHHAPIKAVTWSPMLQYIVTGSSDNTVASWRLEAGNVTMIARLEDPKLVLVNAVSAPDTRPWVAIASRDRSVRLWVPDGSQPPIVFPVVHEKSVKTIGVHRLGGHVVSGSYDGTVCFWRLDENNQNIGWRQEQLHGKPGVSKLSVSDSEVYSVGWDGTVGRWSLTGELLVQFVPTAASGNVVFAHGGDDVVD